MEIRRHLNEHPVWTAIAVVVLVVFSVWFIVRTNREPTHGSAFPQKDYFSIDNGQTYFVGDYKSVPPFAYNGGTAVRAFVYQCPGGEPFVGYLEKFSDEDRDKVAEMITNHQPSSGPPPLIYMGSRAFVKKPGEDDSHWVQRIDQEACRPIITVMCPDGITPAKQLNANDK